MTPSPSQDASSSTRPPEAVESDVEVADRVAQLLGRRPVEITPIAPGLGHRHFLRLAFGEQAQPTSLILRIDPPEHRRPQNGVAPEPELEPIRALLEAHGIPVPRSFAHDAERGWDLLEDVGDLSLEAATARVGADERRRLYREAVQLIPRLQAIDAPSPRLPAFERRLDAALIATKARKVTDWLLPECLGRAATASEGATIERAFAAVAEAVEAAPARLAHRDLKAANLHLRPTPSQAPGRLVLIDLQGAFMAPPEYDLVCLLRDSQVDLPEAEAWQHLEAVREALPDAPSPQAFALRLDQLTLSRVGKDLAHYVHAARDRGDDRYLGFVELGMQRLREATARLRDASPAWHDVAHLIEDLPLPALCANTSTERPPCGR